MGFRPAAEILFLKNRSNSPFCRVNQEFPDMVGILKTGVLARQDSEPYMQTRASRVRTGHQSGSGDAGKGTVWILCPFWIVLVRRMERTTPWRTRPMSPQVRTCFRLIFLHVMGRRLLERNIDKK